MQILCERPIDASEYFQYHTGRYAFHCDKYEELKSSLAAEKIYIGEGWKMTETVPEDAHVVLVRFAKDIRYPASNDCSQYEFRFLRVQKKYLARFKRNMQETNQ